MYENYENNFYKQPNQQKQKNTNYGIASNMRIIYKNYSKLELGISDLLQINKKEIINNLQVITIWEYLLNVKTQRNTEIFNENKILFFEDELNSKHKNEAFYNKNENSFFLYPQIFVEFLFKTFGFNFIEENPNLNFTEFFNFFKINLNGISSIYDISFSNFFPNFTKKNFNKILKFLNFHKIYFYFFIGFLALIFFHFIKVNNTIRNVKFIIFVLTFLIILNFSLTFLFFGRNFIGFGFIFYLFFLSNIYHFFICLVILSGNKEDCYSIFLLNIFKNDKIFFIKFLMVFLLYLINEYFTLFCFKKFAFFLIRIFFMEISRLFFNNFQKDNLTFSDF